MVRKLVEAMSSFRHARAARVDDVFEGLLRQGRGERGPTVDQRTARWSGRLRRRSATFALSAAHSDGFKTMQLPAAMAQAAKPSRPHITAASAQAARGATPASCCPLAQNAVALQALFDNKTAS